MTKTEKTLIDLCELVDAYFQMQQTVVKSAIESQLKERTKEITDDINNKKSAKKTEVNFEVGDWVKDQNGESRKILSIKNDTLHFEGGFFAPKDQVTKIKGFASKEKSEV